jgi:Flp pilus assembly protein TadG
MLMRSPTRRTRTAAALVETAAIASIFMMLLFGVLEYCRFIFMRQIIDNAAREGARFAVVNTNDANLTADVQAIVLGKMNNLDKQTQNFTIQLYAADATAKNIGTASNAAFGTFLCVEVSCDYSPITPAFLRMGQTVKIDVKILMCSEAN